MKSIILCEGATDMTLLQYFMEKVNGWTYERKINLGSVFKRAKRMKLGQDILDIGATEGCSNIPACLEEVFDTMRNEAVLTESINKIVIVTDRDEISSESNMISRITVSANTYGISFEENLENNKWTGIQYLNGRQILCRSELLLLMIPFEEEGALETFLLNAVSSGDGYDRNIIIQGNHFVDSADPENRYLSKRRYRTKAKFDVFFCIRTALEQFEERRSVLKAIPWEDYERVQVSFQKLRDLHVE